jgi:hypothetical protein
MPAPYVPQPFDPVRIFSKAPPRAMAGPPLVTVADATQHPTQQVAIPALNEPVDEDPPPTREELIEAERYWEQSLMFEEYNERFWNIRESEHC